MKKWTPTCTRTTPEIKNPSASSPQSEWGLGCAQSTGGQRTNNFCIGPQISPSAYLTVSFEGNGPVNSMPHPRSPQKSDTAPRPVVKEHYKKRIWGFAKIGGSLFGGSDSKDYTIMKLEAQF